MESIDVFQLVCNAITSVVHPELYSVGLSATHELKLGSCLFATHAVVQSWGTSWSGIALIVNRVTPFHRDKGAAPSMYDMLVSMGTHTECTLDVPDIGANFKYTPGTIIPICGKVLRHGVASWSGGERICFAFFMKDAVLDRLGQRRPEWPNQSTYLPSDGLSWTVL
jgi:hypothetical protein